MTIIIFLETIAALYLKVAKSIKLNELMKLMSIKGHGHSLPWSKIYDFKIKNCFNQKLLAHLKTKFI